ncbi:MAG: hypothetical protein AAFP69_05685 [Planctomycetota bacterium]
MGWKPRPRLVEALQRIRRLAVSRTAVGRKKDGYVRRVNAGSIR